MRQNLNIIHIGLPKCGSTSLQKKIFKKIKKSEYTYYENFDDFKNRVNYFSKNLINKKIDTSPNFFTDNKLIISNERLSGFCPSNWEFNADQNLKFFKKNNHIIIVIRKPTEFLSSCYINMIHTNNIFFEPEKYFGDNNSLISQNKKFFLKKFDLKYFNYQNLIKIYIKRFNKVSIIKFENLFDGNNFFEKLNVNGINKKCNFELDSNENTSSGLFYVDSMKIFFNISSFLLKFSGLSKIFKIIFKNKFLGDSIKIELRITSYFLRFFKLNKLFYFISINFFKKKYVIKFNNKQFEEKIKNLEEEYAKLPAVFNYQKKI